MFSSSKNPDPNEGEGGFTLVELMIVLVIIAILLAIAIPTFLSARARAENRAAEADLRNALTAAKTIYADNDQYASTAATMASQLASTEPSISYTTGSVQASPSGSPINQVSVAVPASTPIASQFFVAGAYSQTNTCFYVEDIGQLATPGNPENLYYASGPLNTAGSCSATDLAPSSTSNSSWFISPSAAKW